MYSYTNYCIKTWVDKPRKQYSQGLVPYYRALSAIERAMKDL